MSQLSTWKSTVPVPGAVLFLEGNIGGPVGPDGGGIIHTIVTDGQGTAQVVGSPGTNTTGILFSVTATSNTAIGLNSLLAPGVGSINNTAFGVQALEGNTTGHNNSGFGYQTLLGVTTGNNNLALGYLAGSNYASSESNNVLLANAGVNGESDTIRIGASQTTAYIAGVYGVSPASPQMVIIDSAGQLGSQVISSGGITTIDGDSGHASGSTITIFANTGTVNSGSSVQFIGDNASTITFDVTDANDNTLIGKLCGNNALTGTNNVGLGFSTLRGLTTGARNVAIGNNAGFTYSTQADNVAIGYNALTDSTASQNVAIGSTALASAVGAIQNVCVGYEAGNANVSGNSNTFIGFQSGAFATGARNTCVGAASGLTSGSGTDNVLIGFDTGNSYLTTESNNILLSNTGVVGDSTTIRVGTSGTHTKNFQAGVFGVNVGSVASVVSVVSGGQLGSTTITAGTGISVTPGANTITIATTGTTTLNYVSVNHVASPYTVLATDDFIGVDASAGVVSILLPNAPATGRVLVVKDSTGNAATNNITITTVGGVVNIDGATSFVMNTAYESVNVLFDGTTYQIF